MQTKKRVIVKDQEFLSNKKPFFVTVAYTTGSITLQAQGVKTSAVAISVLYGVTESPKYEVTQKFL